MRTLPVLFFEIAEPLFYIIKSVTIPYMSDLFSTFFPSFSQNGESSTMKRVSSSIGPGENTDGNITYSIFDLPKENVEKIAEAEDKRKDKNEQRGNQQL